MNVVKKSAFTLIELLVVVAIIGILTAILLPSLGKARSMAQVTKCQANLNGIGKAVQMYISENSGYFPPMAFMPTQTDPATDPTVAMSTLLLSYVQNQAEIFHCPSDVISDSGKVGASSPPPAGTETWFAWQGSSYMPMPGLTIQVTDGKWTFSRENNINDVLALVLDVNDPAKVPLALDYEAFHPVQGGGTGATEYTAGKNILFADFHCGSGNDYSVDASKVTGG